MGKRKFHQQHGGKRNQSHAKAQKGSADGVHGPVIVTPQDEGLKSFIYCRQKFPSLSKKELRNCFYKGEVFLNDVAMPPGVKSEIYSVQLNDSFRIKQNLETLQQDEMDTLPLHIHCYNNHFAVVQKVSGQSVSASHNNDSATLFEDTVASRIPTWQHDDNTPPDTATATSVSASTESHDSKLNDSVIMTMTDASRIPPAPKMGHLLYRLEKSVEGLCVVTRTLDDCKKLLAMLENNSGKVTFTCLVTGYHGAVGTVLPLLEPPAESLAAIPTLSVEITAISRCRSAEKQYLSMLAVTVLTADVVDGDDGNDVASAASRKSDQEKDYFTTLLRNVKKALQLHGMHVVGGDDGLVKKEKGSFIALTSIALRDHSSSNILKELTLASPVEAASSSESHLNTTVTIDEDTGGCTIAMQIPNKFMKLLEKENSLYEMALNKDKDILQRYSHSTTEPFDLDEKYLQLEEGCPVEYLVKSATFCGYDFHVTSDVMIPRKSSEALVHEVLSQVSHQVKDYAQATSSAVKDKGSEMAMEIEHGDGDEGDTSPRGARSVIHLLDVGVGSGCLLLSSILLLQKKFPGVTFRGVGIDICPRALRVAEINAEKLGVASSVQFIQHSLEQLETLWTSLHRLPFSAGAGSGDDAVSLSCADSTCALDSFDILMCNPPYSAVTGDDARLSSSRRRYEPSLALFAPDGQEACACFVALARAISRASGTAPSSSSSSSTLPSQPLLKQGVRLIVEFGHGQLSTVKDIFAKHARGLKFLRSSADCNQLQRCVVYAAK